MYHLQRVLEYFMLKKSIVYIFVQVQAPKSTFSIYIFDFLLGAFYKIQNNLPSHVIEPGEALMVLTFEATQNRTKLLLR